MKKTGYTLTETLITMAIIGVVAASIMPLVNKFKPDPNKAMFLRTYDSLVTILNNIAANTELFKVNATNEMTPFLEKSSVEYMGRKYSPGDSKLCEIVADAFNAYDDASCSTLIDTDDTTFKNGINFTGLNGVQYSMYKKPLSHYETKITADINGDKKPNCTYSTTCPEPDRFIFLVAADGHVIAADPMAQKYVLDRISPKKRTYTEMPKPITTLPDDWQYSETETQGGSD